MTVIPDVICHLRVPPYLAMVAVGAEVVVAGGALVRVVADAAVDVVEVCDEEQAGKTKASKHDKMISK
jgi:hypothetical protein